MHPRLERVKNHVKENKAAYIVGAAGVAVGAAVGGTLVYLKMQGVNVDSSVSVMQGVAFKSPVTVNNTTIVELVRRGHPGFRIQNVETGEEFASVRRVAELFGISRTTLMRHLDGSLPDAGGQVFQKIGEMV